MPNELKPCPFCGASLERCDDSPIYGQSAMHPEADCMFSNNMLFHNDIMSMWNKRHGEGSLRSELAKTQKALDKAVKFINDMTGSCPLDTFDTCMFDDKTCDSFVVGKWQECWKSYFMGGKDGV